MLLIGVGISTCIGVFGLLLAERRLGAFGLVRKKKVGVFKLLLSRKAGNFAT